MMTRKSIKKSRLYIEYKATSDRPDKNIKKGDVTFAVFFNGYTTPLFFEGKRASHVTEQSPIYIRIPLRHCTFDRESLDPILTISDQISFENDSRIEVLTGDKAQQVAELMAEL